MTKEALKLALEALEPLVRRAAPWGELDWLNGCKAITAIKEALAQPEHGWTPERIAGMARLKEAQDKKLAQPEQEPVKWSDYESDGVHHNKPEQDTVQRLSALVRAQQITIDKLEAQQEQERPQNCGTGYCSCVECVMEAQPEPVAWAMYQKGRLLSFWMDKGDAYDFEFTSEHRWEPLYTSPPAQRTWVGLTDEERINISYKADGNECVAVELTEAKLKEKNT